MLIEALLFLGTFAINLPEASFSEFCGEEPAPCPNSTYRSYDGTCNNLKYPTWGSINSRLLRLLPSVYQDNRSQPALTKNGKPFPSARLISYSLFPNSSIPDHNYTVAAMQYGQVIAHDMTLLEQYKGANSCCNQDGSVNENGGPTCLPIPIPANDPFYSQFNQSCMSFSRAITDNDLRCNEPNNPYEQLTFASSYLDLSVIYGISDDVVSEIREFTGGRLITETRNHQHWPPRNNSTGTCFLGSEQEACYLAGDPRINQNTDYTILQVIFIREHNRLAKKLAELNPQWDDERIFQEARKINIGQHQNIAYYEWLPVIFGEENSYTWNLLHKTTDFVNDYDPTIDATVITEHDSAAFRVFHALIVGQLKLVHENRQTIGTIRLSDWNQRPQIIEEGDNFHSLCRGMSSQPDSSQKQNYDAEISQYFDKNTKPYGVDVKAIDIQRARDVGISSYNHYRSICGLAKATTFEDFSDVISLEKIALLKTIYESPDDVELNIGGSLEELVNGTLSGPTFLCIMKQQFYNTRVGDRFFFENQGNDSSGFTLQQLNEIRRSSLSRLLCDNSDTDFMQPNAFKQIDELNPLSDCESLASINLIYWEEDAVTSV